jgi:DNA-directed RNA polymerase subunit M/transcription elongation factor TFIIS
MHFCNNCGNMYYVKLGKENKNSLIYHCRKCGDENSTLISELKNLCVSKTHVKKNTNKHSTIINEYTKLDPTLPRTNKLNCPNGNCPSNKKSDDDGKSKTKKPTKEILYLRYDTDNMKYIYLCCICDSSWINKK